MARPEDVADRISGRERYRRGADQRRVDQRDGKHHARRFAGIFLEADRDAARVGEIAELGLAVEGGRGESDDRDGADDDERDAEPEIEALIADEARRDALVDDIALLEEELPGRDGGADEADDEQHQVAHLAGRGDLRRDEIMRDLRQRGMDQEIDRQQQQAREHQRQGEALEPAEIARARGEHHQSGRDEDAGDFVETEIVERKADADELGDDRQRVEQEQVDHAEGAPELAEALEDQAGMADAGDRARRSTISWLT